MWQAVLLNLIIAFTLLGISGIIITKTFKRDMRRLRKKPKRTVKTITSHNVKPLWTCPICSVHQTNPERHLTHAHGIDGSMIDFWLDLGTWI